MQTIQGRTSLCLALAAGALVFASTAAANDQDPIGVVRSAYVDGIHRNSDAKAMKAGFHQDFIMYVSGDDGMTKVTRDEWAARIEKAGADPNRKTPEISADLEVVGRSGHAAVVKVELIRDGHHVFTDFLSLYETGDGWKIVAKIFTRHP